jgi:simple sugar transport system substrate-binding protein
MSRPTEKVSLSLKREGSMQHMKWIGGAIAGMSMMLAGTSAFAVTIGFSQVGDEGDWRPAFSKDMQDEAKTEGIDLKFADAQGKEEEQLKAVRAFIAQKVDAIIIAPVVITDGIRCSKRPRTPAFPSSSPTATSTLPTSRCT